MREKKYNRIWSLVAGFVFLALGVFVFLNPIKSLVTAVSVIGVFMLVGGILSMIDAWRLPKILTMRSTLLFDGMMLTLLGALFAFGNSLIASTALSYVLLFWFMLTSIIQIQYSFVIQKTWVKVLSNIMNIVVIVLSIYTIFNPILANSLLAFTIAYGFIFHGLGRLLVGVFDIE